MRTALKTTLVVTALVVGMVGLPSAAMASTTADTVMVTTQRQAAPTLNSPQAGWYPKGAHLTLVCYERGQSVKGWASPWIAGGWDNLWYRVADGYYVADVDVYTGTNDPITAPCAAPRATSIDTFVRTTRGASLANAQGTYRGECVSLVSQFLRQVYGITTGAWGNAVDYRAGGSAGNRLASYGFRWSTNRNFRNGDILVWQGGYGHVAVWYNGKIYDQNYAGRRTAGLDPFFSAGYLGYWRK